MFTGIIEDLGEVESLEREATNLHIKIRSSLAKELKIDQSVSHNGVCLTVVSCNNSSFTVTAIKETLNKTNLSEININQLINLERGIKLGDRLDGHMVQGHVDQIGNCIGIESQDGSWLYDFEYDPSFGNLTIEKGSITVNGVSLTVLNSRTNGFSVAIIPYTFNNTNFKYLEVGSSVNLEFDVIGKYVSKLYSNSAIS
ncbi:MAG: riboflavin synthase [Flavobacteriaceae bacterium]|nr:riboflavin synthase [Flavobacteriaceae bacterium]|tara:strand:+ start:300 stop:896 length:597 start_codon:yes stop_codon:yes gene_type:complete